MARGLFVAALVLVAASVPGQLRLEGTVVAHDPPALRISARNAGDTAARDVTPTVVFDHRSYDAAPATIGSGEQREWLLSLPPPSATGTFPATARLAWRDATNARHTAPFVLPVSTPGAPSSAVLLSWTVEPAAPVAHTRLLLENRGTRPLAGRLALVLPGELTTQPDTQPVAIAANGTATVPIAIESRGAEAGTYPVYAVFTYTDTASRHAEVARVDVAVLRPRAGARATPLAIGGAALTLAAGLLAIALRISRRRAAR